MHTVELNVDGLVGPTHHYAGLAFGNTASIAHAHQCANPRAAALQGIQKMRYLVEQGIMQAFLPPPPRPHLALLHQLGFTGSAREQIQKAAQTAPHLLAACYSASSMWTANAATVSSHLDTLDGKTHFTPANLVSTLHRFQETAFTSQLLRQLFHDQRYFVHHPPLPSTDALADEGAANHNRLCETHDQPGLSIFVYGRAKNHPVHTRFPARQTREACHAISRLHGLSPHKTFFVRQHPLAIDAGVFHNDVIGLANESVFLVHEQAFVQQAAFLKALQKAAPWPLHLVEISAKQLSLQAAVKTYLFNAQLLTLPQGGMLLLAPEECQHHPQTTALIQDWLANPSLPIQHVQFMNLKQSMQNGGGPACLRLRVPLGQQALQTLHPPLVITQIAQLEALENWVVSHYRDRLTTADLADPALMDESLQTCEALYQQLRLAFIMH